MEEREFIDGSREAWVRLGTAVETVRRHGVASLGGADLKRMHEDYRRTATDLAYAQTHYPGSEIVEYLNRLVALAHAELYGTSRHRLASIVRFIATGYPRLVRANLRPLLISAALLTGAMALGFVLAQTDLDVARLLVPETFREIVAAPRPGGAGLPAALAPAVSSGITANNIQVSLMAFAGGMTFGALTVYALLMNGVLLGVLAGAFAAAGHSLSFWALIVPHGAIELPAIALAGAAGLKLAGSLLFPGDRTRGQALKAVSADAVRLVLGVIPLLVVAGLIEGFITPRPFEPVAKLAFGAAMAALLALYIGLPGRGEASAEKDSDPRT
ncbi:MAG: stage II sporulation protein M [Coriobacteriia bacterium]